MTLQIPQNAHLQPASVTQGTALPCPFCGETKALETAAWATNEEGQPMFQVYCATCFTIGPDFNDPETDPTTRETAIENWNRRAKRNDH